MRFLVSTAFRLAVIAMLMLAGCKHGAGERRRAEIIMGTKVEVIVRGSDKAALSRAIDAAFVEMRKVDAAMNRFDPRSELSRINAAAGAGDLEISQDMMNVLQAARRAHELTRGAFDPSLGPAMRLWSRTPARIPTKDELASIRELVHFDYVKFIANRRISLPPGMSLDLDGIAKGYGVDRALGAIRAVGIPAALVDAGGDMACYSTAGQPWNVAISDPLKSGSGPIVVLKFTNGALATSGGAERFWEIEGKRYPRIIDPATLVPPENPPASGSAFAANATDADAWATASVVIGDKIRDFNGASHPMLAVYTREKTWVVNDRWKSLFGPPASR